MPHPRKPPQDLNDFERRLRALRPWPATLDRDRLMFEAGRASLRPSPPGVSLPWLWPATTAFSTAAALLLAAVLLVTHRPDRSTHPAEPRVAAGPQEQSPLVHRDDRSASSGGWTDRSLASDPSSSTGLTAGGSSTNDWQVSGQMFRLRERLLAGHFDELPTPADVVGRIAKSETYWAQSRRMLDEPLAGTTGTSTSDASSIWHKLLLQGDTL